MEHKSHFFSYLEEKSAGWGTGRRKGETARRKLPGVVANAQIFVQKRNGADDQI